ncbi:MAG: ABC transporter permease [Candidatus Nanopelagicales bacterium]
MSRTDSSTVVVVHHRRHAVSGFLAFLGDLWRERGLLGAFIRKDLKVKYRGSALGVGWTMIRPLVQLLVYAVVLGIFLGFGDQIPSFGFFMFVGIATFGLFNEALSSSTRSIVAGAPLIKKIAFPRELLPLAAVGGSIVNFGFLLLTLVLAYVVSGQFPDWTYLPMVIPALLTVIVWSVALSFVLSAWNVYYRDTGFLLEVALMMLFWLTPVIYAWSAVRNTISEHQLPEWLFGLYMANPMATAVVAMQQAMWPGLDAATTSGNSRQFVYFTSLWTPGLWLPLAVGLIAVFVGQRIFARLQAGFAVAL